MRRALKRWWRSTTAIGTYFRLQLATKRRLAAEERFIRARAILDAAIPSYHANRPVWHEAIDMARRDAAKLEAEWLRLIGEENILARRYLQIQGGVFR